MIALGHNSTNGAVYSKTTSKLRSALHFRYSIVKSHASFPALILLNPNNHYNDDFHNIFYYNHYVYSDYLLLAIILCVKEYM